MCCLVYGLGVCSKVVLQSCNAGCDSEEIQSIVLEYFGISKSPGSSVRQSKTREVLSLYFGMFTGGGARSKEPAKET